jgi:hypothetical protein
MEYRRQVAMRCDWDFVIALLPEDEKSFFAPKTDRALRRVDADLPTKAAAQSS